MKAKRTIELKITIDEADNEVLEICAAVLDRDPDEVLAETIAEPLQHHVKRVMADLHEAVKGTNPTVRTAFQAKSIARQVMKKNGL